MDYRELKKRIEQFEEKLPQDEKQEKTGGGTSKILVINLYSETSEELDVPELWIDSYSGGPALGSRIWAFLAGPSVDDYSSYESDNPVVFVAPPADSNLLTITFRSPQTGNVVSHFVNGEISNRIRNSGYSAVVLTGRMRRLGAVELTKSGVSYSFVEKLSGAGTEETASEVGSCSILIGPSGEKRIPFSICVYDGKSTGRGGLGFVFGSKNLKAFAVGCFDEKTDSDVSDTYEKIISKSRTAKKLAQTGSNLLIYNSIKDGWAPVCNFNLGSDPRLFHLCGDETKRKLGRTGVKSGCGYAETLMLGSNTGCFDIEKVVERYNLCIDMGIDPVSTGCIAGWLLEATKKEVFSLSSSFSFTDNHSVLKLIEGIARKTGSLEKLSEGIKEASEELGGEEFAYSINGLECGPFDFRGSHSQALNSSLGNLFPVYPAFFSHICKSDVPGWVILNENLTLGLASSGINPSAILCLTGDLPVIFRYILRFIPSLKHIWFNSKRILKKTERETENIETSGQRCHELLSIINSFTGKPQSAVIPDFFIVNPDSNSKKTSTVPINKLVQEYKTLRRRKAVMSEISAGKPAGNRR